MLLRFKKIHSPLCSYCNEEEETLLHLFHSCIKTKKLWNKFRQYFSKFINIPHSTPQSSILGIFDNNQHSELINHPFLSLNSPLKYITITLKGFFQKYLGLFFKDLIYICCWLTCLLCEAFVALGEQNFTFSGFEYS